MSHFLLKLSNTLRKNFFSLVWHYRHLEVMQESYVLNLLAGERYRDPKRLSRHENQCFSQNGQDGIIAEIFNRIGTQNKTFVEIGCGDGTENNTAHLLTQGWSGSWLDGSASNIGSIEKTFSVLIQQGRLKALQAFITRENVAGLLAGMKVPAAIDLLSVDIDRNTYFLLDPIASYRPRVVVVEYNASYLPADEWTVEYHPGKVWNSTNYMGASLKSLELLMDRLGYYLVGCDTVGVDAFFVRKDLAGDHFCQPYTSENHYEPPRLFLVRKRGHASCFSDMG